MDIKEREILGKIKAKGYWKIRIHPVKYKHQKIPLDQLKVIILQCQVRQRGWHYPSIDTSTGKNFLGDNYLSSLVEWREFIEIWRFYDSARFVQHLALVEDRIQDSPYSKGSNLGVILALYNITEFFMFARNLAARGIMEDAVRIEIQLCNTNQRKLIAGDSMCYLDDIYTCQSDNMTVFMEDITVPRLLTDFAEIALDSTVKTFNSFNWISPDMKHIFKKDQDAFLKGFFQNAFQAHS